jgi:serine/threonine protein kinase, bacterial
MDCFSVIGIKLALVLSFSSFIILNKTDNEELLLQPRNDRPDTSFIPEAGSNPFPGYELVRLRGRGGFAEVWEAVSPTGESLALKFLSTQQMSATARELRALRAIHSLEHPHLLKTRHIWCLPGSIVIGMELADATLLDLFLLYNEELRQPIEFEKLLSMMFQAALAIDFLNTQNHTFEGKTVGLQHGDIKPNNLMMVGDVIKLADYGLATPIQNNSTPCHRHGTLDYVSAEVMNGRLTEYSDQFSLAVTYHVLRAGCFPFPASPPLEEVLKKGLHRPLPDLSHLPSNERMAVSKALSSVPQNRHPNCVEFIKSIGRSYGLDFVVGKDTNGPPVLIKPLRTSQRIA